MKKPALSKSQLAQMFNVPIERINQQYKDNAAQLRKMAEKARQSGKKVNGATSEELQETAGYFEKLATAL